MQFIINQAITLFVSVALLSSNIDASGGIRGGGSRFLQLSTTSRTTGEVKGFFCGSEGDKCNIDGEVKTNGQIRYGHAGSNQYSNWKDITDDKPFTCQGNWNNDHAGFGMDPKQKSKKNCYWRENPSDKEVRADESIKKCANDGTNCACVGRQARFGQYANGNKAGDRWTNWIDVQVGAPGVFDNGSINCVQSSFGGFDPAKGVKKVCECRDIPSDSFTFDNYLGRWEKSCENCNSFDYKETFTFTEGTEDSVSEAFMEGWSLGLELTVGFESSEATGGASGSVTVSNTIQESYERETTRIITNSREQSIETSCSVTACENGTLFRWLIEGNAIQGSNAQVATCNFVCVPHEDQQSKQLKPVCPPSKCNFYENCQCALEPWLSEEEREAGEDEKLCTTAPTSAPTKAPTSTPTKAPTSAPTKVQIENPDVVVIPADKLVLSCINVKRSDGSDGASCDRYGGWCPFLSTESNSNNGEEEKCYCGLSHEDAKQNTIPCNYHLLN